MDTNTQRYTQIIIHRYTQIYTDINRYAQIYTNIHRYTNKRFWVPLGSLAVSLVIPGGPVGTLGVSRVPCGALGGRLWVVLGSAPAMVISISSNVVVLGSKNAAEMLITMAGTDPRPIRWPPGDPWDRSQPS